MSSPKVSVVIVNWNNFADTAECLESLKKATYSNLEVVVVDNGSQGDDVSRLRERFGDYVRLIANDKNLGFAQGCNIGIEAALAGGADYVALLNNDTVVAPDFLDGLVAVTETDRRIGIAGGKIYCYEFPSLIWFAGGVIDYWTARTPIRGSGQVDRGQFDEIAEVDWICGCFMLISRDLLQTVGLLDKRFFFGWEDVDFCVRSARKGFKIVFVPDCRIWHKGFGYEKRDRLMGRPVYYATRGQILFMEKNLTKLQFASAMLHFFAGFPKWVWEYSLLLRRWEVPLYILWGILGYLGMRGRECIKL